MLTKADAPLTPDHYTKALGVISHLVGIAFIAQNDKMDTVDQAMETAAEKIVEIRRGTDTARQKAAAGTLTVRDVLLMLKPHVDRLHGLLSELEAEEP